MKFLVGIATTCLCLNVAAEELEIVNIRVGQGDATLIKGPADAAGSRVSVLVDAGNIRHRDGGHILRAVLAKRDVDELDAVIVTHYDADHIGGIVSGGVHGISFLLGWNQEPGASGDDDGDGNDGWLSDNFFEIDPEEFGEGDDIPVGRFVDRGDDSPPTSQAYRKYVNIAEAHDNRVSLDDQSKIENFEIDLGGGATMIAIAGNGFVRDRATRVANVNTENERSLSFLVSFGDFDYLISGDLIGRPHGSENARVEAAVGAWIEDQDILVDVLHANHHGANNGSEATFLESIQPTIAVISAGNGNDHSHPNRQALQRLVDAGIYRIFQTSWGTTRSTMPDRVREVQAIFQNDVVIHSDGDTYTISTSRTFESDKNPNFD